MVQGYDISALPIISLDFNSAQTVLYKNGGQYSKKTSFQQISSWIRQDFFTNLGVKGAAFCQSSDFAVAGHEHSKYTSAYYEPPLDADSDVFAHVHISADRKTSTTEMRMQKYNGDTGYKVSSDIGALKFMADPHVSPKDPYDAEFDGWIFPGQTVECAPDEFKNACLIYAGNAGATEFTVPPLSDFIKFSCGLTDDQLCRHVDFCKGCPSHSHAGELTADFSIKYDPDKNKDFKLYTNGNSSFPVINTSGNKDIQKKYNNERHPYKTTPTDIHAGKTTGTYRYIDAKGNIQTEIVDKNNNASWLSLSATTKQALDVTGVQITRNDGRRGGANVPSHNLVPILVYIGMPDD